MEQHSESVVQTELWTRGCAIDEHASEARPLHWYEGTWEHQGQTIATIRGSTLCYVGGGRVQPVHISGDRLFCNVHGSTCEARIGSNGQLVWSDGNIWIRKLTNTAVSQFQPEVAHVECAATAVTWRGMTRALANDDRGSACTERKSNSAAHAAVAAAASVAKFKGVAAFQKHDFSDAVQNLLEATKLNPSDKLSQQLLTSAQLSAWADAGIPVLQVDTLDAATRLADDFGRLSSKAKVEGHAALQSHNFAEAVRCFSNALTYSPNDEVAKILLQQAQLQQWEAMGLPVMRLACYADSFQLAEQIEEVNGMSMAVLREWYFAAGFPAEPLLERDKIVGLLKQVKIWQKLPLSELEQECDRKGIPVCTAWIVDLEADTEVLRNHLSKQLLLEAWMDTREAGGINAHRIGDASIVIQLVLEYELADKMSFTELSNWYNQLGFPREPNLQLDELLSLMKAIAFWQALPLAELQRECREQLPKYQMHDDELSAVHDSADGTRELVTALVQQLVLCNRMRAWESRGCYQASRLGDADTVVEVIHRHNEIDGMTKQELDAWYAECGFPDGNCLKATDVVSLRKLVAIWQFLSIEELRQECVDKGLLEASGAVSDESQRPRLVDQLLIHERMEAWEGMGLPARRIGEPQAVAQLVHDCQAIRMLSMQQLHAWYAGLGLPIESSMTQEELMRLHKACIVWSALPLDELHKECIRLGVEIPVLDKHEERDGQRSCLVYALLLHDRMKAWECQGFEARRIGEIETVVQLVCTYESYQSMEDEEFATACAEEGLALSGKTSRTEMMPWLKTLLIWQLLPLPELVVECQERGLPTSIPLLPADTDTQRSRNVLLQRLQADMKLSLAVGRAAGPQKRSSASGKVSTTVSKDAPVRAGTIGTTIETPDSNVASAVAHRNHGAADPMVNLEASVNEHIKDLVGTPKAGTLAFEAFLEEHGFGSRRPLLHDQLSELQEICGQIS